MVDEVIGKTDAELFTDKTIVDKNRKDDTELVPGGIVLYEWDGKELKILHLSKYYEDLYGYSMINNSGSPDFARIHPDDVKDYQRAISKAINDTHHLEYVFRVWNKKRNSYGWTQINAISKEQPDGKSLVYDMYTDVNEQKIAEQRLMKSHASIMAALRDF